jgi:hypothetical protein
MEALSIQARGDYSPGVIKFPIEMHALLNISNILEFVFPMTIL